MYNCLIDAKTGEVIVCTRGRVFLQAGQSLVQSPEPLEPPSDYIYDFHTQMILEKTDERKQQERALSKAISEGAEAEQVVRLEDLKAKVEAIKDGKTKDAIKSLAAYLGVKLD